jgi:hypothetical protein
MLTYADVCSESEEATQLLVRRLADELRKFGAVLTPLLALLLSLVALLVQKYRYWRGTAQVRRGLDSFACFTTQFTLLYWYKSTNTDMRAFRC